MLQFTAPKNIIYVGSLPRWLYIFEIVSCSLRSKRKSNIKTWASLWSDPQLLYNIKEQELLFVEAKHFTNKEIRAEETPAVINQIERYNKIIQDNYDIILQEYSNHIQALNNIFKEELKTELPEPKTLCKECGLIIFGFDNDQKNGYLESNIKSKLEDTGIKVYARGNVSEIDIKTLYNSLK